jgi:hypothetical protein
LNLHFVWASSARAELRAVERDTAMRILLALTRYAETGEGDLKPWRENLAAPTGCELATGA